MVVAGEVVFELAVVIVVVDHRAGAERVGYRAADRTHVVAVQATVFAGVERDPGGTFQLIAGLLGIQQYCTTGDVTAEEGSLGTA